MSGNPHFTPDSQTRLIMGIGGSLLTGWTFLLLWAVREPIERRAVILLTAFPVVEAVKFKSPLVDRACQQVELIREPLVFLTKP